MGEKKPESSMEEEEKTSEVWETEKEERMERASGDILKEESAELLKEEYGSNVIVNPPTAGGKILKDTTGVRAAGARCGYPSKPCDR